ncbi:hypothetical protein N7451_012554 [Penicillium sp. IBT 35674x]|nr:hypothetical protein N7451_012554 [Penicillium sp. IBT 35674x]
MAYPPRDAFQIGWICALPIEAAAAAEMLDEKFGILQEQDAADSNTYTLGRIGKHHVVIACLPGGQYGTTSATTVAINMLRTFSKSLKIGLMVGIGGGIPSASHDIRLGDIVISCPEGTCGGVIQYDMGKVIAGGEFERTGSLNSPPRALLTAVSTMRAAALTDDPRYLGYLQNAIGRTPRTRRNFGRPSTQSDRLFQTKNDHRPNASSCDRCLAEWEETRGEREDSDPQPHYGIIASGNKVIKDGRTREQFRLDTGALCFEMEASGLMLDFPCIVIRGICDYSDSHKNKEWQGYAALAAAAYTKELLGYVPVGHVSQETLAVEACNVLKAEIQGTNQRLDQAYDQQEQHHREKVVFALTDQQHRCHQTFKISPYEEQKNINPKKVEGTCLWALQSPEYIRWSESRCNDLLWVSADPGCGKSVLSRSIIEDCLEGSCPEVTICYFFFKDNDDQNHLAIALCSVLHQLFWQRPHLLRHAIPSWEKNGEKLRQEVDELWRIFTAAVLSNESCKIICLFDALDECREIDQDRLIEKLRSFHRLPRSPKQDIWLKFLVTSRPYDDIQNRFRAITDSFPHLHLKGEEENDQIHQEIDLVVKMRVKELAERARLSPDTVQRLEQQLLQMEHRTYLWLHLAIDDIRSTLEDSLRPSEEEIQMIPQSVDEAYENILSRSPPRQVDITRKILQIIIAARRPLTTAEMAMALGIATSPQAQTAAKAGLEPSQIYKKLRRLCGLFVFINNSKIYLIHQTAREFLVRKSSSNSVNCLYSWTITDAEDHMAILCLRYLLMEDLEHNEYDPRSDIQSFLDYSAQYWPDHRRKMSLTQDQEAISQVRQMYDVDRRRFSLWFPIFWKSIYPQWATPPMTALQLASFNGHEQEVGFLLSLGGKGINSTDGTGTYPIIWASLNGYKNIVQLLLENGAEVNAQGGKFGNALQAASSGGHDKIVQLLLENGAEVNAQGGKFGNALQAACSGGHDKIVQLLLENGAEVDAQSEWSENALHIASSRGDDKIVQLLLENGAEVDAEREWSGNALHIASSRGDDKIVQLLLENGAEVNAQGGKFGNALQAACSGGHDKIVQLLLENGAEVNAQGGEYRHALQAASSRGDDKIVQLLLENGAEVNAQGGPFRNALQAASSGGHDKIVQLLLENGAEVNSQGGKFGNALQAASSGGHDKIVQLLLENGAEVNAQGGPFRNALQAASSGGHDRIVQLLLENGAEVNAQGGKFGNALQAASSGGHDKIVQLLLENGAEVNAQGGPFRNALQAVSSGGHDKIVQLLLENGAEVNAQGGEYRHALQAASSGGHDKIVQLLLENGAEVNAQGGPFRNALQAASSGGHDKIVQLLLENGAEVNSQGGKFGNALQAASSGGHDKIVQLLLENGAEVNAQGGPFRNALQAASSGGHDKIVQLLLENGAEVNAQGGEYGNALQAASSGGHDKIVQLLLENGAEVNAQGGKFGNALQAASSGGHEKIVQLLLENGAEVNAQGGEYGNALQAASFQGHENIVQLLLENGAEVNAQGGEFANALQAASFQGHENIVQLLLDNGAKVNAQGGRFGNTPQAASFGGHDKIVQLLLDNGAKVNAQGGRFGNTLQAASFGGHDKTVQLLLDNGAEVNAQGGILGNALQAASFGGHDKIVQLLLENGAEVNAQGGILGNALQAASSGGHDKIVQLLLENGAEVNAQGGKFGNALQAASSRGRKKIVQLLLDNGAEVNAQGGEYGNALQAASSRGRKKIVQLLLDNGAEVNAQGGEFGNALQAASSGGHDKIVQLLLENGAEVNAQGRYGNALQAASARQ